MKHFLDDSIIYREYKEVALTNTFVKDILPKVNMYQRRLFLLLINEAQPYIKGQRLDDSFDVSSWSTRSFTFKIRQFLNSDDDENYTAARKAIQSLMNKRFPFSFGEKRVLTGEVNFINGYLYDKSTSTITISMDEIVWQALFNFAKGFQYADLYVCLMCSLNYSIYFYSKIYDTESFSIGIDSLKEHLGLAGKYKNNFDFIKKVIMPAQEELDKISPKSFTYEIERDVNKRGCPIKSVVFKSRSILENQSYIQRHRSSLNACTITAGIYAVLIDKLNFTREEINRNRDLIYKAQTFLGADYLEDFIRLIAPKASRADNPRGYTINAIRKHVNEMQILENE